MPDKRINQVGIAQMLRLIEDDFIRGLQQMMAVQKDSTVLPHGSQLYQDQSSERLQQLFDALNKGDQPGGLISILRDSPLINHSAYGRYAFNPTGTAPDTLFLYRNTEPGVPLSEAKPRNIQTLRGTQEFPNTYGGGFINTLFHEAMHFAPNKKDALSHRYAPTEGFDYWVEKMVESLEEKLRGSENVDYIFKNLLGL